MKRQHFRCIGCDLISVWRMRRTEEEINANSRRHSAWPLTPQSAEQVCIDPTQRDKGGGGRGRGGGVEIHWSNRDVNHAPLTRCWLSHRSLATNIANECIWACVIEAGVFSSRNSSYTAFLFQKGSVPIFRPMLFSSEFFPPFQFLCEISLYSVKKKKKNV